jgi:guanylate kinase
MDGQLFIVSAPSGAGKTTLVRALLRADPTLSLSVSYTTRPPRPAEQEGRDYHFVSRESFDQMLGRAEFLESAEVHGNYYGTSEAWVRSRLAVGGNVILEIDWQGAEQIRRRIAEAIGIFIMPPPPPIETLARRLRARNQDPPEVIARRLQAARTEMAHAGEFDYVIINDLLDEALSDMRAVMRVARLRTAVQFATHPRLLEL